MSLIEITRDLSDAVDGLTFAEPVTHVYNPLRYAWAAHEQYLRRFGTRPGRIVLLGMNPGPFGMAQTGVPFGDVGMVRDFIGITAPIGKPAHEHPRRPVQGFDCPRGEVSGQRLWGWARQRYGDAETFFDSFFVVNFCPLVFMEDSGRNRTPDKLPKAEREALHAVCEDALGRMFDTLAPRTVIGIGRFAEAKALTVLGEADVPVICAPHPSPASPVANRGWAPLMDAVIDGLDVTA